MGPSRRRRARDRKGHAIWIERIGVGWGIAAELREWSGDCMWHECGSG